MLVLSLVMKSSLPSVRLEEDESALVSTEAWFPSKMRKAFCLGERITLSRLPYDVILSLFACILCTRDHREADLSQQYSYYHLD